MKLKLEDKINIIAMLEVGHSQPSLAKKYSIGLTAIKSIVRQPKTKYKSYKGEIGKICPSLLLDKIVDTKKNKTYLKRNFTTTEVNQKWTTDVSEFHIAAGKLYLSPILDMHNRKIVSYTISRSPNFKQIIDMLNIAFNKHKNLNGLIFHSDQGWQYQMKQLKDILILLTRN